MNNKTKNNTMTKKEIKEELQNRDIKFDSKANKPELEELLRISIAKDAIDEDTFSIDKYEAYYTSKGRRRYIGPYASVKDAEQALDKLGANVREIIHVTK